MKRWFTPIIVGLMAVVLCLGIWADAAATPPPVTPPQPHPMAPQDGQR